MSTLKFICNLYMGCALKFIFTLYMCIFKIYLYVYFICIVYAKYIPVTYCQLGWWFLEGLSDSFALVKDHDQNKSSWHLMNSSVFELFWTLNKRFGIGACMFVCVLYFCVCTYNFCFLTAVFVSLRSILLVDLLGIEMLTKSFGILILFQGVATMAGAPVAGMWHSMASM